MAQDPGSDQVTTQKIMDRIEQLEFALAEAVMHFEAQTEARIETSQRLAALSEQISGLSQTVVAASGPAEPPADLGSQLSRIADRLDAATAARADETAMIAARLSALEEASNSRLAPIEAAVQSLASKSEPQEDFEAIAAAASVQTGKALTDRHAAHIAQLVDRFTRVEAALKLLPDQTAIDGLRHDIGGEVERARQPVVTRLDALTGMIATLGNDLKSVQEMAPDLSNMVEPLMARMDRLDTAADQRQRDFARELDGLAAQPVPGADLTPIRESFARLMVALQAMHQSRESSEVEILNEITSLSGDLVAMSDRISSGRSESDARTGERLDQLSIQLEQQSAAASQDDIARLESALSDIRETTRAAGDGVKSLTERPAPTLDIGTIRSAFSQQMVAIGTWMKRQDVLQSAMSDLLETLVERRTDTAGREELADALKTLISAGQFSTRKQIESVEARLSEQVGALASILSNPNHLPAEPALLDGPREGQIGEFAGNEDLCADDRRLLEALGELRRIIANAAEDTDASELAEQARQFRLTLAETLAGIQAGQVARI